MEYLIKVLKTGESGCSKEANWLVIGEVGRWHNDVARRGGQYDQLIGGKARKTLDVNGK